MVPRMGDHPYLPAQTSATQCHLDRSGIGFLSHGFHLLEHDKFFPNAPSMQRGILKRQSSGSSWPGDWIFPLIDPRPGGGTKPMPRSFSSSKVRRRHHASKRVFELQCRYGVDGVRTPDSVRTGF